MTEKRRAYDAGKDQAAASLYRNARWQKASRLYRAANPLCVRCGGLSEAVDHIIPHRGDVGLFWSADNWQSLCTKCNTRKRHEDAKLDNAHTTQ